MNTSFTAKIAEKMRERLAPGHPFTIEADPEHWEGYIFVTHSNGASVFFVPYALDKRHRPNSRDVNNAMMSTRAKLYPHAYYTPEAKAQFKKAHRDWVRLEASEEVGA